MLVLSRKVGEAIQLSDDIEITVLAVENQRVRLGIRAPKSVTIRRTPGESNLDETNRQAVLHSDVDAKGSVLKDAAALQKKITGEE
jgi:carbon storage regulator